MYLFNFLLTSSSSSSSIGGAGGKPAFRISAFEAVCTFNPVLVSRLSPEALHVRRRERPLLAKGGSLGQKWPVNLACYYDFHVNHRVHWHAANLRHGTDGFTSPRREAC
jgi:hypothetical protein